MFLQFSVFEYLLLHNRPQFCTIKLLECRKIELFFQFIYLCLLQFERYTRIRCHGRFILRERELDSAS